MLLKLWHVFGHQSFKLVIHGLTVRCRTTDWTDCQRPKKSHSVSRARLTSNSQDWSVLQDRRRGAREENSQRSNWTSQDIQSKKMSKRTIHGQSQKPRDIEENLNSEHLVKNNLHVSLHLYSAQSFKKLNFSQHVPFKNSSDLGLEEPTPRFSHSGPSDCLKLQKVRRTTPQSRHTQHPAQIPMLQRTVQYNEELYHMVQHDVIWIEIIQNKRKEKKKHICDIKYTLTWDREPVLKHVVWTHSCCDGRPCSLHTEERLGHASLRLRSSSTLFFHTVHLKENNATKHKKRQN